MFAASASCTERDEGGAQEGLVSTGLRRAPGNDRPHDLRATPPAAETPRPEGTASTPTPPAPAAPAQPADGGLGDAPEPIDAPLPDPSRLPSLRLTSPVNDDPIAEAAAELFESSQQMHWSQPGSLGPEDLTIRIQTPVTNAAGEVIGTADFNLRALNGYQNSPKCNLLAFEVAFRAGFVVPLVGRALGWGFPASGMLATDAADGDIRGDWAVVRRRPVARELNLDRDNGVALMVVGAAATAGRYGHVALIDWVEELRINRDGEIETVSFMGWEAKPNVGARYGQIRFVSRAHEASARFSNVYILELRAAEPGNEVAVIGARPRNPTQALNLESGR